jgi:hypothetical protein
MYVESMELDFAAFHRATDGEVSGGRAFRINNPFDLWKTNKGEVYP